VNYHAFRTFVGVLGAAVLLAGAAFAQETPSGKLKVHVDPEEAYTFIDGQAYGPGQRTITLPAGDHTILIANYGFTFHKENVSIEPDSVSRMEVTLKPAGGPVSGPRGRIQLEPGGLDAGDDAVLLNGDTPDYFVGHVDEFNNELIAKQELIVPPGTHKITVTRHGKVTWSGTIVVAENKRVIVDLSNGNQRVKQWDRGTKLGEVRRFKAGIASATIVIAPVSGSIAATPSTINCNQTTQLAWNSAETIDADIHGFSPVPVNGSRMVSPKQTTTYEFTAMGPGGMTKSSTTVQVNPTVNSSLTASPMEVRYRKIGDKVLERGSSTLNWTTTNADAVSIAALGPVANSGTESVKPLPTQTGYGPVNENVSYTLRASNVCGGSDLKTVAVHMIGSIEPIPAVALQSVFFPTAYPMKKSPAIGLLGSQRQALATLAAGFTKYLEYDPDAKLTLVAHTDTRGPAGRNMELAERRAEVVKGFLVTQGIAAEKITVTAMGLEQPIDAQAVATLESQNPAPAPALRSRDAKGTLLAYQRRVDLALLPANMESKRFYPNGAPDSQILWQKPTPPMKMVEKEQ